MTRTRIALTLTTLGLAGLLGLTGCGVAARTAAGQAAAAADVTDEAQALRAVGFDTGLAAAGPSPSASASAPAAARPGKRHKALRRYLRKNTLHGEVTVQGRNGVRTIVVQRGTVTTVTSTGVSVKSTDGFALTWTFGDKLRVVQNRRAVPTSTLKAGEQIGVAGTAESGTDTARLIAIG